MTDLSTNLAEPITPDQSTQIDMGKPTDPALAERKEGEEAKPEPKKEPESRIEAIKRADADLNKGKEPEAKAEEKPEAKAEPVEAKTEEKPVDAKAEPTEQEKAQAAERAAEQGKRHVEPPKTFLPREKELWRNVPREVQAAVERLQQEHETNVTDMRKGLERYENIREFDQLAQQNGRDLKDSLVKINHIENLMQQNPMAGLNAILMEIGPRKADGQPVSLYEVAMHIANQGPEAYQRSMMTQAPQQQQRQPDPEVQQLKTELANIKHQQVTATVIEPFAREHPRYHELQEDIAFFLNSGKIPQSLSLHDRLAAAYDMAERINPPSNVSAPVQQQAFEQARVEPSSSGAKSVKGAPSSGLSPQTGRRGKISRMEALDAAYAELGLAN